MAQKEQKIIVDAKKDSIERITDCVNELLDSASCPVKERVQIDLAIDEMLSNVINYAYEGQVGEIAVSMLVSDDKAQIVLTFEDSGVPFDPTRTADPDITLSAEDRKIGGLGIFMVKKTMDKMEYQFKDGKNVLRLVKKWNK